MQSLQYDKLRLCVFPTRAEMGAAAGAHAATAIARAIEKSGAARVILASAPSQSEMLETLVSSPLVDWSRVTIFHMDEYVGFTAEHPASFRRFQAENVLNRISPRAFHGIQGEAVDPSAECARYAALLAEAPIDVVCLGIGENGHLAFNDPPVADFSDPQLVKEVELDDACRQQQVNDGCFPSFAATPRHAITLTIPALLCGVELVCTVPGPRKAQAVKETVLGPIETSCPASAMRRHENATLYCDAAAAALALK